jgi:hypothetical protein
MQKVNTKSTAWQQGNPEKSERKALSPSTDFAHLNISDFQHFDINITEETSFVEMHM